MRWLEDAEEYLQEMKVKGGNRRQWTDRYGESVIRMPRLSESRKDNK
jgi:hypothetical protein